jgi:SsrA-binding protein
MKVISQNRKAYHDYSIEEKVEAGIALTGTEIKSVRAGRVNLGDGYARPEGGELWLFNIHIAKYDPGSRDNHEPRRPRKLLLHRRQINELSGQVMQRGYTLVPLRMYLKNGIAKVELGLARGKKLYDKRESIARREAEQRMERALKLAKQRY